MVTSQTENIRFRMTRTGSLLVPILLLWGCVAVLGMGFLWFENGFGDSYKRFYLLPWVFLTGAVVLAPTVYLLYKGKFDAFHPLVYAAWSYVFPAFVIGG